MCHVLDPWMVFARTGTVSEQECRSVSSAVDGIVAHAGIVATQSVGGGAFRRDGSGRPEGLPYDSPRTDSTTKDRITCLRE